MTKKISSESVVKKVAKSGVITEREILLLCHRMNHGECVDLSPLDDVDVYVTDEQSQKGLDYLRKHFLTKRNKKRKNCSWGDYELKAIGYNGEGEPLTELNCHHLFKFYGYMNIGKFLPYYSPIYEINGVWYYMKFGSPVLLMTKNR